MTEEQKIGACIFIAIIILGFTWVMYQVELTDPDKNVNLSERQCYYRIARCLHIRDYIADHVLEIQGNYDKALQVLLKKAGYEYKETKDTLNIYSTSEHLFIKTKVKTWYGKTKYVYSYIKGEAL
jgi:hypothetical protein